MMTRLKLLKVCICKTFLKFCDYKESYVSIEACRQMKLEKFVLWFVCHRAYNQT